MVYRSHIALLLVTVIGLNVLAMPVAYLNFRVNQDYYASVLCENPEEPITVCGGVCYLKKQLPASEDTEPATFVSKIDLSVYYQVVTQWSFDHPAAPMEHGLVQPPTFIPSYHSLFFRPPQG